MQGYMKKAGLNSRAVLVTVVRRRYENGVCCFQADM